MINISETFDIDLIRSIVTDDDIYPYISDDLSPPPNNYTPQSGTGLHWLLVTDANDDICGLFFVHRCNAAMYECHTCLLKGHRGQKAVVSAIAAVKWVFENTPCEVIVTHVPAYNHPAYRLAQSAGFSPVGVIANGWLKNGELHNLNKLEITRCQQREQ
jgi:RimJ/RimL family protein N-acetyltransferase